MGVVFARFAADDRIIALARNTERNLVAPSDEAVIDAVGDNDAVPAVSPGDVIDAVEPVAEADQATADDSSTGEETTNE
jgi:DNA gyrase subunit A